MYPDIVCVRCGRCCELTHPEMWEQGNLDEKQKNELIKERGKYSEYPEERSCRYHYCRMLVFEGKLAICLVHKFYGYKAKPKLCQDYPGEKQCAKLRENMEKLDGE